MFANPPAEAVARLLREAHIIAVVGLSSDRTRPSHGVAKALQRFGYRIVPVNPLAESILGEPAVACARGHYGHSRETCVLVRLLSRRGGLAPQDRGPGFTLGYTVPCGNVHKADRTSFHPDDHWLGCGAANPASLDGF